MLVEEVEVADEVPPVSFWRALPSASFANISPALISNVKLEQQSAVQSTYAPLQHCTPFDTLIVKAESSHVECPQPESVEATVVYSSADAHKPRIIWNWRVRDQLDGHLLGFCAPLNKVIEY